MYEHNASCADTERFKIHAKANNDAGLDHVDNCFLIEKGTTINFQGNLLENSSVPEEW